ncbi:MAG: hypothetical protein P1V97_11240 [Planctomycetota bacterium]|nr:hypothetical protein [Planctomycetota bacterium]
MRATKKRPLHQRFQIPAEVAEEKLTHLGFHVVQKSPTTVILYGPKKANPRKALTYFSRIALSQHDPDLHLTALYRDDEELSSSWLRRLFPVLLPSLIAVLIAIGLSASTKTAQILTGVFLAINLVFATIVCLNPSPPNSVQNANLELESLLNQIMNQPKCTKRESFRTIHISSRASLRCAYCHDDLVCKSPYSCPDCKTQIHRECMEELDLCPTLGCLNTSLQEPTEWQHNASSSRKYTKKLLNRSIEILNSPLF